MHCCCPYGPSILDLHTIRTSIALVVPLQGFIKSWGMILLSEIGDKTFFIAAIMAMKNPRRWVRHLRRGPLWPMRALNTPIAGTGYMC